MFMESLREEDGYFVLSGLDNARINAARYHLAQGDFYVPAAELVGYGQDRVQTDPKIAMLYSQSAGMAAFLMLADDGRYRDALIAYLSDVYSALDRLDTLAKLLGFGYDDLDRRYRTFMKVPRPAAKAGE